MPSRQVLLPADDYPRLADRLAALDHDIEPLLWHPDGVAKPDGTSIADGAGNASADAAFEPEAAWVSISLLFSGVFPAFVEAALAPGTLRGPKLVSPAPTHRRSSSFSPRASA